MRTRELPDDLPVIERDVVRLVVVDRGEKLLLFHTRDLDYPELRMWWELPGGGLQHGETYVAAAIRELREETGLAAMPAQVGPPTWRRDSSFRHHGVRRLQHEVVVVVRLAQSTPAVSGADRLDYEVEDYVDFRWWSLDEVVVSGERFYPGRLPELLPAFLSGEEIDEPFELWS